MPHFFSLGWYVFFIQMHQLFACPGIEYLVISWFAYIYIFHSESCLFLSWRGSLAVQMVLRLMRSRFLMFG